MNHNFDEMSSLSHPTSLSKDLCDLYIGLMSGTSLDAMDAVLVDMSGCVPRLLHTTSLPFPLKLREELLGLCQRGENEIERMAIADIEVAKLSAQTVTQLLSETSFSPSQIRAIGSHGQTIRHLPSIGNTLQIGSPSHIAELTGILTVADFRRRDLAAGGQGAPLVPAFHAAMFQSSEDLRVIVNVGGIANITVLPPTSHQNARIIGFDTGPGNVLLDYWCHLHCHTPFDNNGEWAASGRVHPQLLSAFLSDPYFSKLPPKSTGRELFNSTWLHHHLTLFASLPPEDIQATLSQLTAQTIADSISRTSSHSPHIFLCGGGAKNKTLIHQITSTLPTATISTTSAIGIDPQWVEAMAFAWLAYQTLHGYPGNLPSVTNAIGYRILGGIYPV
jgi:anhydro-N-acetylmuramic acid kinase